MRDSASSAWHEEESFWEAAAPVLFSPRRLKNAPAEVEAMVSLLELQPRDAVLDLCCGVGRHSIEFALRGYDVTGVDRTGAYLEQARQYAAERGVELEFVQGDMRTFARSEAFDAVINYFTSFGYFESEEEEREVLSNACLSLKPGGRLLIDLVGKEVLARIFTERGWHEEEDGLLVLEERELAPDWSRIRNRWMILKDGGLREITLSLRLYSAAELSRLLAGAGFEHVDVYGDLGGAPYDMQAKRMVTVAHKRGAR
jgi:SAM-dependent methyltransferase